MSLTSAMQSIVNDFKTTAARMFTGFPTGTTHSMCTMTKLYLIQGQVDTVSSAKCSWIQSHRSSHNASSNGCTCSLSSSPLTNCSRRLKKKILHDYVTKPCLSASAKQGGSSTEKTALVQTLCSSQSPCDLNIC